MPRCSPFLLLSLAVAGALSMPGAALAQRVGVSSAVNQEATGMQPGAPVRPLALGEDVVFNERVATGPIGQAQLLFLDKSAMTIGPDSDLTIDQFAYDPATGAGRIALDTSRGILRYVGGAVSKQPDAVTVHTSLATIAVRGGTFISELTPGGALNVYFIYGIEASVTTANGISETIRRPGFAITVAGPGAAPSAPYPTPPGALASLAARLDGRAGGSGGARRRPNDSGVAASGIDNVLSGDVATTLAAARRSQPPLIEPTLLSPATFPTLFQVNTAAGSEEFRDLMQHPHRLQ